MENDERLEELESLTAIFPELVVDASDRFSATLDISVQPTKPLLVRFVPPQNGKGTHSETVAYVERDVELAYLPPITIRMTLPEGYPASLPSLVNLSARQEWLPTSKIAELEAEVVNLWEEYGHCQILYSYIDHLQQAAERGFDLHPLILPSTREADLLRFDMQTCQETFNAGTYDCGICLEPKKGSACYKMKYCGHIFCCQCLQDFYNNAIKEGDVAGVRCLDPTCGEEKDAEGRRKPRKEQTLHPRELLAMSLEESVVRRYLEMKRKKKLEADKSTVYCPRTWCQGPARSDRYPPIPSDLTAYIDNELSEDKDDLERAPPVNGKIIPPDPSDRLAVCEKCQLAFCKVCYMGWHGPFARCFPRDPNELGAEEKASYDYIRLHTSPCPYCNAPVQKTMGCNHMNCFQCRTHFCYLCGSWLDAGNPYQHFNKAGTPCYQRLWELEEGDEGQAPEDGRGFIGGARGWEQAALDVARQADEDEAQAAVEQAQAEEDQRAFDEAHAEDVAVAIALDNVGLGELQAGQVEDAPRAARHPMARRPRNLVPARPHARGAAQAVRNHERARGDGRRRRPGLVARADGDQRDLDNRAQAELQRFLELAQRDEEDGWDSDELDDDDDRFVIPNR